MTLELRPVGVTCNLRCQYCLPPDAPVLYPDLTERHIDSVVVGDVIVGFDEHHPKKLISSTVENIMTRSVETLKVLTTHGLIEASPDHRWLVGTNRWRETQLLKPGQFIHVVSPYKPTPPIVDDSYKRGYVAGVTLGDGMIVHRVDVNGYWQHYYRLALIDDDILDRVYEYASSLGVVFYRHANFKLQATKYKPDRTCGMLTISRKKEIEIIESWFEHEETSSYRRGFLAGMFDAEGSWSGKTIRISQKKDNGLLLRCKRYLEEEGIGVTLAKDAIRIHGGQQENFKFWQTVTPACSRKNKALDNGVIRGKAKILSIESGASRLLYDITTSTRTFVAYGLATHNCYEEPQRTAQPVHHYDREKVLEAVKKAEGKWSLFGGEALILPLPQLVELLEIAHARFGETGVQTNGTLITDAHIEAFVKYNTHVGISVDGPDELNDTRWAGTLEATRKLTARSHDALHKLLELSKKHPKIGPSLIITLQAGNASKERWPKMKAWLYKMDELGLKYINFHTMEMDANAKDFYIEPEQLKVVMLDLWEMSETMKTLKFTNFREIMDLLNADDKKVVCVWRACDPWNTSSTQGIEGDGRASHCSRTNKDGIDWLPAEGDGVKAKWAIGNFDGNRYHERQLSLYVTPEEHGGCKDCRFWMVCQGQCPGGGEESVPNTHGDWRLKSTNCKTWKDLFTEGEKRMQIMGKNPISQHPNRKEIEAIMYEAWSRGFECSMSLAVDIFNKKVPRGQYTVPISMHGDAHGDSEHGDHGDAPHEDHVDARS